MGQDVLLAHNRLWAVWKKWIGRNLSASIVWEGSAQLVLLSIFPFVKNATSRIILRLFNSYHEKHGGRHLVMAYCTLMLILIAHDVTCIIDDVCEGVGYYLAHAITCVRSLHSLQCSLHARSNSSGEGKGLTSTLTTFPFLSMCTCPSVTSRQRGMRYNMLKPPAVKQEACALT